MEIEDWPEAQKVYAQRFVELFGMPVPRWAQVGAKLKIQFSRGNDSFKDSKYFLDPSKQSFSHLTTYKGLYGIINSGLIRLYSLDNSNDPNELFSLSNISNFKNAASHVKPYVYTFSFCKSESIANSGMWLENSIKTSKKSGYCTCRFSLMTELRQTSTFT